MSPLIVTAVGILRTISGITVYFIDGSSRSFATSDWDTNSMFKTIAAGFLDNPDDPRVDIVLEDYSLGQAALSIDPQAEIEVLDDGLDKQEQADMLVTNPGRDDQGRTIDAIDFRSFGLKIKHPQRIAHHMADACSSPQRLAAFTQFLNHLQASKGGNHAIDELLDFLENHAMPLTHDGHILCYKRVHRTPDGSLVDQRTRSIPNTVGSIVSMPPEQVNPDRYMTCSHGLHVCSKTYLPAYDGNTLLLVKVNPAHIISVPNDYHNSKMRVCAYLPVHAQDYDGVDVDQKIIDAALTTPLAVSAEGINLTGLPEAPAAAVKSKRRKAPVVPDGRKPTKTRKTGKTRKATPAKKATVKKIILKKKPKAAAQANKKNPAKKLAIKKTAVKNRVSTKTPTKKLKAKTKLSAVKKATPKAKPIKPMASKTRRPAVTRGRAGTSARGKTSTSRR